MVSRTPAALTVIGLGRMGAPIARHLRRAGHEVTVFDRDPDRMLLATEHGWRTGTSAAASAAGVDVVITILPGAAEFEDVMLGAGRVVESLTPGACWLDLTSNDPRVAERVAGASAHRGVAGVGAPMGGGVDAAETASLDFYVGGSPSARDLILPILEVLARPGGVHVVGDDIGSGYSAKLLINLLWFGQVAAVSEALLLGERLGIAAGGMRGLIAGSPADSAFAQRHLDRLLDGDYLESFGLRECVDELDILTALARVHDTPFDVSTVVARLHRDALDRFGAIDGELSVARLLEERSGIQLRRTPRPAPE